MTNTNTAHIHHNTLPTSTSVSLIICSRGRPALLAESVTSILQGDDVPAELIIIDQSDVPHADLARLKTDRRCEIRYVWTHSRGLSRANNLGVATARHDLLVFTHDDVAVTPSWLGTIVRTLCAAGPKHVVTGRVLPTYESAGGFALSTKQDTEPAIYAGRIGEDVLFPLNMAMYRSAFDEVGFFDERIGPGTPFPGAEDNDFGFRLLEAGYHILYAPEAVIYHRAWRPAHDYLSLRWSYGRGQGAFYAKHLHLTDHYMFWRITWSIKSHILQFVRRVHHHRLIAYGEIAYILGMLSAIAQWLFTNRIGITNRS